MDLAAILCGVRGASRSPAALVNQVSGISLLGACPTLTVLLRRTICSRLRCSRLEKILDVFHRIHLRFFRASAVSHPAASPSPRHEGNVGQAPSHREEPLL